MEAQVNNVDGAPGLNPDRVLGAPILYNSDVLTGRGLLSSMNIGPVKWATLLECSHLVDGISVVDGDALLSATEAVTGVILKPEFFLGGAGYVASGGKMTWEEAQSQDWIEGVEVSGQCGQIVVDDAPVLRRSHPSVVRALAGRKWVALTQDRHGEWISSLDAAARMLMGEEGADDLPRLQFPATVEQSQDQVAVPENSMAQEADAK